MPLEMAMGNQLNISAFFQNIRYMVRSERERRGLSQSRLAEQAGVSTRTISDIETCNGNPELATLIPIAQFLNISIDAAVQDERKEPDTTTYQIMKETVRSMHVVPLQSPFFFFPIGIFLQII